MIFLPLTDQTFTPIRWWYFYFYMRTLTSTVFYNMFFYLNLRTRCEFFHIRFKNFIPTCLREHDPRQQRRPERPQQQPPTRSRHFCKNLVQSSGFLSPPAQLLSLCPSIITLHSSLVHPLLRSEGSKVVLQSARCSSLAARRSHSQQQMGLCCWWRF